MRKKTTKKKEKREEKKKEKNEEKTHTATKEKRTKMNDFANEGQKLLKWILFGDKFASHLVGRACEWWMLELEKKLCGACLL